MSGLTRIAVIEALPNIHQKMDFLPAFAAYDASGHFRFVTFLNLMWRFSGLFNRSVSHFRLIERGWRQNVPQIRKDQNRGPAMRHPRCSHLWALARWRLPLPVGWKSSDYCHSCKRKSLAGNRGSLTERSQRENLLPAT